MDDEVRRLGGEVEKLFKANSERRDEISGVQREQATLRTAVYGINGDNGLNGRVKEMEERIEKEKDRAISAKQFFIGQVLTFVGIVVSAVLVKVF